MFTYTIGLNPKRKLHNYASLPVSTAMTYKSPKLCPVNV